MGEEAHGIYETKREENHTFEDVVRVMTASFVTKRSVFAEAKPSCCYRVGQPNL